MANYKGRQVKLNKPFRTPNKSKKFGVYVKDKSSGNVKVVRFGDPKMKIKKRKYLRGSRKHDLDLRKKKK